MDAGPEGKSEPLVALKKPFDWSGFYIGGHLGGMLSDYDFGPYPEDVDIGQQFNEASTNSLFELPPASGVATFFVPERHETTDGSVIGGGQIGFQKQWGHWVFGVEGDFDRTSSSATSFFTDTASSSIIDIGEGTSTEIQLLGDSEFTARRKAEMNWTASARGRIGFAQGPLLFYGTGGVAWAEVRVWANDRVRTAFTLDIDQGLVAPQQLQPGAGFIGTLTNQNISRSDETYVGWTGGGGIEIAVSDAVTVGLEYRHNDFGSETVHFDSHGGPIFPGSTEVDISSDQVTLRCNVLLSHFFGHQEYAGTTASADTGSNAENMALGYTRVSTKDKNVVPEVLPEPFSWTGLYLGGNIGGTWTDYNFGTFDQEVDLDQQLAQVDHMLWGTPLFGVASFSFPGSATGGAQSFDAGSDASMLGGGEVGFNKQWGHFVAGIEADFDGAPSSQSITLQGSAVTLQTNGETFPAYAVTNVSATRKAEELWRASVRGRFGYAAGPGGRVLLYATGGVAWSDVRVWAIDSATTDFFQTTPSGAFLVVSASNRNASKDDNIELGWTVGGGGEYAFNDIVSVGLEYRHNGFGDHTYNFTGHHGPVFPSSTRVDLDSDQVTFRVNFLLGHVHGP